MATLESGFNPTYSKNASILTGNPDRVTVEVEDTIDKDFWSDLLGELCPGKEFHFDPYHTILNKEGRFVRTGKGKSKIIKASSEFNAWHIGCVDSDYDWILSDYTEAGKVINSTKYLLQTYAYSIENLMCLSCTLGDLCFENTEETAEFDFNDYLTRLSKAIYPLLVWSTYLCSKSRLAFTPAAWRDVLVNTEKNAETSLTQIEAKAKAITEDFDKNYAEEITDKEDFELSHIYQKDVTHDNAYLYVRGHELFDHLLNSVLNPVITYLRSNHYNNLRDADMDVDSRKLALQDYRKKDKSVKCLLQKNFRYKNNSIFYDKISADVSQIWDNMITEL